MTSFVQSGARVISFLWIAMGSSRDKIAFGKARIEGRKCSKSNTRDGQVNEKARDKANPYRSMIIGARLFFFVATLYLGVNVKATQGLSSPMTTITSAKRILFDTPVSNNGARCRIIAYKVCRRYSPAIFQLALCVADRVFPGDRRKEYPIPNLPFCLQQKWVGSNPRSISPLILKEKSQL